MGDKSHPETISTDNVHANRDRTVCITREIKDTNGEKRMGIASHKLRDVLLQPGIGDKPIAIISIAGAKRGGKSFMLNYILRYLREKGWENSNWIGDANKKAESSDFEWRCGSVRCTTGLRIFKEKFEVPMTDGGTMIVLIMDTQGLFDNKTPETMNKTLLTLSTLLSSVQIFNVMRDINTQHLGYLKTCIDFAMKANEDSNSDSYLKLERLMVLIRDSLEEDVENQYSLEYGEKHLTEILDGDEGGWDQLSIREKIKTSFQSLGCFLLPHPGLVAASKNFEGTNGELDEKFKEALKAFVNEIANPANLTPKSSAKSPLTGREIVNMIAECDKLFSKEMFDPLKMLKANAFAQISSEGETALHEYIEILENRYSEANLDESRLRKIEKEVRNTALRRYDTDANFEGEKHRDTYRDHMKRQFDDYFNNMLKRLRMERNQARKKFPEEVQASVAKYESQMKKRISEVSQKFTLGELHQQVRENILSLHRTKHDLTELENALNKKYEEIKLEYSVKIQEKMKTANNQKERKLDDLVQLRLKQICVDDWNKELQKYRCQDEMKKCHAEISEKIREEYWSEALTLSENKYRNILDKNIDFVANVLRKKEEWSETSETPHMREAAQTDEEKKCKECVKKLTMNLSKEMKEEMKNHKNHQDAWTEVKRKTRREYLRECSEHLSHFFNTLDGVLSASYNDAIALNNVLWVALKVEMEGDVKDMVLNFERELLEEMSDKHIDDKALRSWFDEKAKFMKKRMSGDPKEARDHSHCFIDQEMKELFGNMSRKNQDNKALRSVQECDKSQRKRDKIKGLFRFTKKD